MSGSCSVCNSQELYGVSNENTSSIGSRKFGTLETSDWYKRLHFCVEEFLSCYKFAEHYLL